MAKDVRGGGGVGGGGSSELARGEVCILNLNPRPKP